MLSTHYQKFQQYILKNINILEHILELYNYKDFNSLMNIHHKPTINITTFYIHLLEDESSTIFNFIDFEDNYKFLNNFINIFQKNISIIGKDNTVVVINELHL